VAELGCRLQKAGQETHTDSNWRNYSKLRREADSIARFLHVAPAVMSDAPERRTDPTPNATRRCGGWQAFPDSAKFLCVATGRPSRRGLDGPRGRPRAAFVRGHGRPRKLDRAAAYPWGNFSDTAG
jgi:hypothetical protein